jgi:hypothetical protein
LWELLVSSTRSLGFFSNNTNNSPVGQMFLVSGCNLIPKLWPVSHHFKTG